MAWRSGRASLVYSYVGLSSAWIASHDYDFTVKMWCRPTAEYRSTKKRDSIQNKSAYSYDTLFSVTPCNACH